MGRFCKGSICGGRAGKRGETLCHRQSQQEKGRVPQLRSGSPSLREGILPAESHLPDARICASEEEAISREAADEDEHLLQTSEAARADGRPRWFVLTALIHDLGKILCLWDEPQWAVVGDTFPVGCAWSDKIVFHEFFAANPDAKIPQYQTRTGVYEEHCGLDKVDMSWGHDEYIYHVAKDYLPEEAHYMLRYHSFYPAHREGEYQHLMSDHDQEMFYWVREFNQYDLYSKSSERPNVEALRPYYEDLISEYFPAQIDW